jgi:hypothetical protein
MTKISDVDRAALELAIEYCCAHSEQSREQIHGMLRDRSWEQVAKFASFSAQTESLDAAPFEHLPCDLPDNYDPATDPEPIKGGREAYRLPWQNRPRSGSGDRPCRRQRH